MAFYESPWWSNVVQPILMLAIGAVGATLWNMHGTTTANESQIKGLSQDIEEVQKGVDAIRQDVAMVRERHNRLATEVGRIQGRLGSNEDSDEGTQESIRLNTLKIPKTEIPNPNLNTPKLSSGDAGNN